MAAKIDAGILGCITKGRAPGGRRKEERWMVQICLVSRLAHVWSRGLLLELLIQNIHLAGVSLSHGSLENQTRQRQEV